MMAILLKRRGKNVDLRVRDQAGFSVNQISLIKWAALIRGCGLEL